MNRFTVLTIASSLALASFAGAAIAASSHTASAGARERDRNTIGHDSGFLSGDPASPGPMLYSLGYPQTASAETDHIIRQWKGGRIAIVPLADLSEKGMKASLEHRRATEPAEVAALKSAIEHNHRLADRIEARNIPIGSVIDAQTERNGDIIFYVR